MRSEVRLLLFFSSVIFFQHANFLGVSVEIFVRGLKVKWQGAKRRMIDHADQCLFSDVSLSDTGVAVFVSTEWVLAVIQMNGFKA